MEPSDHFESHLKEILDPGPAEMPVAENDSTPNDPAAPLSLQGGKNKSERIELLIRIIGIIALIALLSGFALRVSLF